MAEQWAFSYAIDAISISCKGVQWVEISVGSLESNRNNHFMELLNFK